MENYIYWLYEKELEFLRHRETVSNLMKDSETARLCEFFGLAECLKAKKDRRW